MKIGPREQIIFAFVAVIVIVVVVGGVAIVPQWQRLNDLNQSITQARSDNQTAKQLLEVRVESKNRAADTDAKWLRLANLVPDGPDLPSLIVELQDAAFASGVQIVSIAPSPPTSYAKYYSIPITMQVIGSWADSVDFLERIMKLNRGVRIVESSSARTTNTEQAAKENLPLPDYATVTTIKLEAYMIPSEASSSTPDAATH
jgi:Tfp pilus assembly protein PilO